MQLGQLRLWILHYYCCCCLTDPWSWTDTWGCNAVDIYDFIYKGPPLTKEGGGYFSHTPYDDLGDSLGGGNPGGVGQAFWGCNAVYIIYDFIYKEESDILLS